MAILEIILGESDLDFDDFTKRIIGDVSYLHNSFDKDSICDFHASPETNLSMFRYSDTQNYSHTQNCMVHKDNGFITLLPKSTAAGIQVLHNDQWFPMEEFTKEGQMLVYLGESSEVMSNHFLSALRHRVVRQPGGIRYSSPFEVKALKKAEIIDGLTGSEIESNSRWQRTRNAVSRIDTVALLLE